jgi:hypothetical protein
MNTNWLIAIDDTDNLESIGTGRLARMLAAHLASEGQIASPTVTRHQLLVHPDIPYTSHNSSACISASGGAGAGDKIFELAQGFLRSHPQEGANPGLCVAEASEPVAALQAYAREAQRRVLRLEEFDARIAPHGLRVWSAGETGQGRIGAVCGVALRSTGEDGRFLELPGLRSVRGRATVGEILDRTGVDRVVDPDGAPLGREVEIETRDWIRPSLVGGEAIFTVTRDAGDWVPIGRHEKHSKDDG